MPRPDNTTPEPSGAEVTRVRKVVQGEGGRVFDIAHGDREDVMELPHRLTGRRVKTTVPLCSCGRRTVVAPPLGEKGLLTACVACDALTAWPRYAA